MSEELDWKNLIREIFDLKKEISRLKAENEKLNTSLGNHITLKNEANAEVFRCHTKIARLCSALRAKDEALKGIKDRECDCFRDSSCCHWKDQEEAETALKAVEEAHNE